MASRALRRAPRELGFRGVQVLALIRDRIETEGQAPSYAQIRDALGFSHEKKVLRVITCLENRGLVRRVGTGRVRRIRLIKGE